MRLRLVAPQHGHVGKVLAADTALVPFDHQVLGLHVSPHPPHGPLPAHYQPANVARRLFHGNVGRCAAVRRSRGVYARRGPGGTLAFQEQDTRHKAISQFHAGLPKASN